MKADRKIVLTSMSKEGKALESAANELNADRRIVLTSVSKEGNALRSAVTELETDREIVWAAGGACKIPMNICTTR